MKEYLEQLLTIDPRQRIGVDVLELADHLLQQKRQMALKPFMWNRWLYSRLKELPLHYVDILYQEHSRHEIIKDIWLYKKQITAFKVFVEKNETRDREECMFSMEV